MENLSEIITFSLVNPSKTMAVSIKLNLRDSSTGKRILPAYISDGYFTLLPGESRVIRIECPLEKITGKLKITSEGLNVPFREIHM
jgi:hypothetical protein